MIVIYALLAVAVIGFTDTIWTAVGQIIPGYPFATDILPSGHSVYTPEIGKDPFWYVIVTPFLNMLAGSIEPCFPYFAVSFIGSIIGIVLTKPKNEINKKFPRNMLLIGLGGYTIGVAGIISVIVKLINTSYSTADSMDVAIAFYRLISFHRHWFPDAGDQIYAGLTINIPPLSWLWQFICLTGFSLMLFMLCFRLVEFRGISKGFANNTRMIRRFGVVAFSNYNNQWLFRLMFFITSLMIAKVAYKQMFWGGTFLTVLFTFIIYIVILFGWEKIGYIGSLEWFIRTVTNNAIPIRRKRFYKDKKWWQRGQIDVENSFKNPEWINFVDDESLKTDTGETARTKKKLYDSNLALAFSLIGFFSIALILLAIPAFFVSIASIRKEGKNAKNITALVFSVLTIVLMISGIITMSILKIGLLGLFPDTSLF